jgi:hypothetical protein
MQPEITDPAENERDEADIIADQDQTLVEDADDKNMGADGTRLSESEPADFVRGEIDVKEQMDRLQKNFEPRH